MKRKNKYPVAKQLSEVEIQSKLLEIGKKLKEIRKKCTTMERLAYELDIAKSYLIKCEAGCNMSLKIFLKIIYGLRSNGYEFFKQIKRK